MSRILRIFAFVFGVFYASNVLAAGYTCPTYKQYTSCASGYYMTASASSTAHTGTSAVGNACRPCSVMGQYNGVDKYTCAGGTAAPVQKTVTVSYNLNNGTGTVPSATTCKFGESCTLNAGTTTAYYRAGYRLVGWSTSSSATSGSFSMTLTANTTVYAVWSKCASGTYKGVSATAAATCTTMSYGYYGTGCNATYGACTGQAQCTGTTYCEDHIKRECPDPSDATHQRTTIPAEYKGSKFSSASVTSANGRGAVGECRALIWYDPDTSVTSGQTVGLYEYVYLDDATMRYQGKVDVWAYDAVGPGYYLYGKGVCGAYAYYKTVAECPIGAACPGKSKVLCDSSNESTVHTETFGLNVCSGGKTTTATGATTCSATCSNATGANTWTTPTWSSSTKQILNKCAISTCSTGYTRGGTASSTATSSYTCAANCNKITLNVTQNGGSGGAPLTVYKKTGLTTWYSDSACSTVIEKLTTLPTKTNATYGGFYNTTAASGGTQCVDAYGKFSTSTGCNVTGDKTFYAQYVCQSNYQGSGTRVAGTCTGTVRTIYLKSYDGSSTHSTIYQKYATGWYSNSTATTTLSKATVPTRTGYTFRGFYTATQTDLTASGGTGTRRITADGTLPANTTFTSNSTLYAAWATNCVQPSNGKCTLTISSTGTATYTTTCNAGYYIGGAGTYKPTCTPCGDGTYSAGGTATSCTTCPGEYTHSDGARSAIGNCYLTTTAGKYVKTAGAGQVACDDPTTFYYPGGARVYYGETGGDVALGTGEWNAVNVGGTCADKEYCPAGTWGDVSGYCEPIPAGYYPEVSGCYTTDDDGNGIGCWSYEPCSGLSGVSVTGGTYTSAAQSKNNKACKYTAPAKTIAGCATVTVNTVSYTGMSWPASTYTVTPSAGYVASNNNTASATCSPGIWTITLNATTNGGTGGTSAAYEKYNTGWYSNAAATTAMSTITIPTKTNSVFNGYYTATTGGTQRIGRDGSLPSNTTFTANTTLYAQYSACAACTKGNGVASCSLAVKNNTCTYSATCSTSYKNPTCTSDGKCSCTGNTFYIKYNAGGGTGNAPTSPTVCTYGSGNCWAPANTYTRTGYTFSEWSDGDQPVPAGQEISKWYGRTDGETITLTAMWSGNTVKCDAGYYVKAGEDKCTTGCSGAFYCPGGTFTISGGDTGKTPCPSTTLGGRVSAWTASGYPSKPEHCLLLDSPFTNIGNGDGTRRLYYNPTSGEYDAGAHYYYYESCNAGYQMTKNGTYNGTPVFNNACTMCAAGTYKGTKGTGACAACVGRTKFSAAGATGCSTVSSGYYTTGCNTSGNACTGQTQCTGATYCASGIQNSCPAQTSGWTRNGGTGWTAVTQCNQTKTGAAISSYCAGGVLQQNATSATAWGETKIATALTAKQGSIVNGQTCSQCGAGTYSQGDTATTCGACPAGDSGWTVTSPAGSSSFMACYETQTPANCASGTVKRAAVSSTTYSSEITLLSQLKSKAGYYASATATSCTVCPAGSYCQASATAATKCANWTYAPSTGMAACTACPALTSGWTKADSTGTGWTSYTSCVQISPTPAGCASGNNKQVAASNGATTWAAATVNTALSAKAGYIVSGTTCPICTGATYSAGGTATSCTTCPSIYTSDKTDGKSNDSQCKVTTTAGQYIATAGDSTQTKCPAKNYCPSASVAYGTANSPTACPAADSTTERTTYPTDYLNPTRTSFTQQSWSSGLGAITSCSANYNFTNEAGRFTVESVYYNATTGKYDTGGGKYYSMVNPGWYLVDKYSETYCNNTSNRMLYHNVATCPENHYCPGYTSIPLCSPGTYENEMGIYACSSLGTGVYTKSPAKSGSATACYLTTTATNFVKTANTAEEKCTAGGYCLGGTQVNWGSTGGRVECTAGTYNPNTGASAASACVKADAGYYVPSTGATSQTACSGATYTETTGATSCTACPTATGATSYRYYKSGNIHSAKSGCYAFFDSLAINNGTLSKYHCYWDTTNNVYNTSCGVARADLKCNAKYYAPAFGGNTTTSTYLYKTKADITSKVCQTVGGGYYSGADVLDRTACPTGYGNGAAGAINTDCQMKVAGGKYVAVAAESTASGVCDAGYAKAEHYVNYNSTSSCTACTGATYTDTTGAAACTACPTVDASKTPGGTGSYGYWNLVDNTSVHSKKDGCVAFFNGLDLEHGHVNNYRCYWNVNSNSYDYYCTVARGEMSCDGGYFTGRYGDGSTDTTEVGFGSLTDRTQGGREELTKTCRDVKNGYYSPDRDLFRYACPAGQTTIGYGAGADEAADCGRILHIGDDTVYLRNTKKTTPSLNVQIGDTKYYGDMTSGTTKGKLRVKSGTTTYSVHDDSM